MTRRIGEQRSFGRAQTTLDAGSGSHEPFASDPSIGNVRLTTDSGWWWRSRLRTRMTARRQRPSVRDLTATDSSCVAVHWDGSSKRDSAPPIMSSQ